MHIHCLPFIAEGIKEMSRITGKISVRWEIAEENFVTALKEEKDPLFPHTGQSAPRE